MALAELELVFIPETQGRPASMMLGRYLALNDAGLHPISPISMLGDLYQAIAPVKDYDL